ncbi:uncharacterized protein C2orf42 homolog isoform X2 [Condylostylus longicornis]|uniref:uncharacterized protein C2orf42 homolog isoform X2 n=1 Tax=Condylostylus longicornis TaxID=2530218 RepID=UPI00244DDC5A|nr:uncharacterized protein C2orf42 homolog isoform X2 [Condylostylus longicornis]
MDFKSVKLKPTMRGVKKCKFCGYYNGFRAKSCKNKGCFSFVDNISRKNGWIDPIELISNNDTKIFSVRVKERDLTLRNFVEITDTTLLAEDDYTSIISRNAICFADTCKYDVRDLEIICKHVKSTGICNQIATGIEIDRKIIDNLKISQNYKDVLWNMYNTNLSFAPPLQRLNNYTFAVQCCKSISFPAGRLHVVILPDGTSLNKLASRYQCTCKNLKGSSKFNKEYEHFCFHILFLLTGIMSSNSLQYEFNSFCKLFDNFWSICEIDKFQQIEFVNFQKSIVEKECNSDEQKNCSGLENIKVFDRDKIKVNESQELKSNISFHKSGSSSNIFQSLNIYEILTNECNEKMNIIKKVDTETCTMNAMYETTFEPKMLESDVLLPQYLDPTEKSSSFLNFSDWLNFVIEKINTSIQFEINKSKIVHHFNIHENFFILLHDRFSSKGRKRLPDYFNFIKFQNRKLIRHLWLFSNKFILNQIFNTDTLSIQFEKICKTYTANIAIPEVDINCDKNNLKKYRQIKPKRYVAYIRLKNSENCNGSQMFILRVNLVFSKSNSH